MKSQENQSGKGGNNPECLSDVFSPLSKVVSDCSVSLQYLYLVSDIACVILLHLHTDLQLDGYSGGPVPKPGDQAGNWQIV